jgi:hypothetical protein
MKSCSIFSFVIFALLLVHETEARLVGWWWFKQDTPSEFATVANSDRNVRYDSTSNKMSIIATVQATVFDSDVENGDGDTCYDCCCDRDVICNINGKSDATCLDSECEDGATCTSKGYTCPSYDCNAASDMW